MRKGKDMLNKRRAMLFVLVIVTLFMGIGYASVNSVVLNINGTASALAQKDGVLVTSVDYSSSNNVNIDDSKIIGVNDTVLNSMIVLSDEIDSSITYTITVNNFTDEDYTFIDTVFYNDFYDNDDITFEVSRIQYGYILKKNSQVDFDITFKYAAGIDDTSDIVNVLNSYLNFRFLRVVKYIEGTGTQYIDTGVIPNNNTTFEMSFALTDTQKQGYAIFGARTGMSSTSYNLYYFNDSGTIDYNTGKMRIRWDDVSTFTYMPVDIHIDSRINVSRTSSQFTISADGNSAIKSANTSSFNLDNTMYVFNINQHGTPEDRYACMKLFLLKIYDSGNIIRDYIPVLDEKDVPCLYDLVENKYYYNELTDNFEYGYYENVGYVESTGTQYIDTGYYSSNLTSMEFAMSLNDLNATQAIFGSRNGQTNKVYNMFLYKSNLRWDYLYSIYYLSHFTLLTHPNTYVINNDMININGESAYEYGYTSEADSADSSIIRDPNFNHNNFKSEYSMYIFTVNDGGNAFVPTAGMKLYYFDIFENGVALKKFVPAIDMDGVACLYDVINDKAYYNASGNGNFDYGI